VKPILKPSSPNYFFSFCGILPYIMQFVALMRCLIPHLRKRLGGRGGGGYGEIKQLNFYNAALVLSDENGGIVNVLV
jgi:hypothetical protein